MPSNRIGAKRLVIDSLVGFEMALAPGFRADFRESLYRMIGALTGAGVTILSTVEVEDSFTALQFSHYAISFLTDDIIRLRYVEIDGQLRKVLVVVKMRGGNHSKDIREYVITDKGVVVIHPRLHGLHRADHRHPAANRPAPGARRRSCPRTQGDQVGGDMRPKPTPGERTPPPDKAASSSGSDPETAQFHEKMLAMNEALMVGSVRQHELAEAANLLNARLQAEIIERTQAEAALLAARAELAQANAELEQKVRDRTAKLQETVAELEHFSHTITHDMRAPLRAMYSFGGILLEECSDCLHPTRREYIRRVVDAAERMDKLITDALQYSGVVRQRLEPEPVDADALLRGILESYPEFQPPQANIHIDSHLPVVLGNQAGLTQCFSNLLANAVKFVHPGQAPEVRVWAESVQHPKSRVRSRQTEESAVGHATRKAPHKSVASPLTLNPQPSTLPFASGSRTRALASNSNTTIRSGRCSNSLTRPTKGPASGWPWSARWWTAWAARSASSPSPATAAASGSN